MSEIYLRVVAWNIWEGNELQEVKMALYRGGLWDVVLLNEVRYVDEIIGLDVDQTKEIAETLSLPYYQYAETATTGFRGTKGVAILSRHPIIRSQRHFVVYEGTATTFATLQSTVRVGEQPIEVFSTRFQPMFPPDHSEHDPAGEAKNQAGHQQALVLINSIPGSVPVIFGGDFNANWGYPWATNFRDTSGLIDVMVEHPREGIDNARRVDYIYYRPGRYRAVGAAMTNVPRASDHPYVQTPLLRDDAVLVPYVEGLPLAAASERIRNAGLVPKYSGSPRPESWVTWKTQPGYLEAVARGSKVALFLRAPDQVGRAIRRERSGGSGRVHVATTRARAQVPGQRGSGEEPESPGEHSSRPRYHCEARAEARSRSLIPNAERRGDHI